MSGGRTSPGNLNEKSEQQRVEILHPKKQTLPRFEKGRLKSVSSKMVRRDTILLRLSGYRWVRTVELASEGLRFDSIVKI